MSKGDIRRSGLFDIDRDCSRIKIRRRKDGSRRGLPSGCPLVVHEALGDPSCCRGLARFIAVEEDLAGAGWRRRRLGERRVFSFKSVV